ncbi:MAG: hypothetical protein IPL79_18930 [Myxococcales bacterium]|nr:hypothetical protein [Myxococcales bacterium]
MKKLGWQHCQAWLAISLLVVGCGHRTRLGGEAASASDHAEPSGPHDPAGPPPSVLAVGYMQRCCLTDAGRVDCAGGSEHGESKPPAEAMTAISAGLYTTCGIDASQRLRCWGQWSPASDPTWDDALRFRSVAVGRDFACALTLEKNMVCWSSEAFTAIPSGPFERIDAGYSSACAMRANGEVRCAGFAEQPDPILCDDLEHVAWAPVPDDACEPGRLVPRSWSHPPKGLVATTFAVGDDHACARTTQGAVVCWGAWGYGDGNTIWSTHLFPPKLPQHVVKLTAGGGSTCALTAEGEAICWGGQAQTPLTGRFLDIDAGANGTCGLRADGTVECFDHASFAGTPADPNVLQCAARGPALND